MQQYLAVVTNVTTRPEAEQLAQNIVSARLAACAQIEAIESIYHWDGKIQHSTEFRILFKTTVDHYDAIESAIKAIHPYQLPPIHAVILDQVETLYGSWINDSTTDKS